MKRRAIGVSLLASGLIATASAVAAAAPPPVAHESAHHAPDSNGFTQTFTSASSIHPPLIYTSGSDPDPVRSGDIFVNAANSIQSGPMILNPAGQLIWFEPLPHGEGGAYDVNVQPYQGHTVLTYFANGVDVMLNHYYQQVGAVTAGNGYILGIHEFQLTPQGTALISVDKHVPWDLSSVGGSKNGTLIDDGIQEVNVTTGQVLWQWDSDQHVPITASYAGKPTPKPYDFFHLNSIQQLPNGNLLISARHTFSLYEINKQTGQIIWRLGGKHTNFKMGPGTSFAWQHDARMQADGTITLFDDGAGLYRSEPESRAVRIRLNYKNHTATLVRALTATPSQLSWSQGNMQALPDGNTFVGFGSDAFLGEFAPNGKQLFEIHFTKPIQTYRAYRYQWWGHPTTLPSISVGTASHGTWVWASWDGSTQVVYWQVLAGASPTNLNPVGKFRKLDFETQMFLGTTTPLYFAVQALDADDNVLATSQPAPR